MENGADDADGGAFGNVADVDGGFVELAVDLDLAGGLARRRRPGSKSNTKGSARLPQIN